MKVAAATIFALIVFLTLTSCDQLKDTYKTPTLYSYFVLPQSTNDSIQSSTVHHYAFVDTRVSQSGKLLVFLGSTGSVPQNYASLNKVAIGLGYYVINLSYLNTVDGQACASQSDINCFENYHEEMLFGNNKSSLVVVNKYNAINARILKLLQRLHKLNPSNGWEQFYQDSELIYSKMVLSGHAQVEDMPLIWRRSLKLIDLFCSQLQMIILMYWLNQHPGAKKILPQVQTGFMG